MADGMQSTLDENLELERQLKLINKLPVKSIRVLILFTKFGYIVDCIDINKQPAFDHPLLKNHKLQRKPSFWKTKSKTGVNLSPSKSKARLEKVVCPEGTVPIRRTTKDDLIKSKKLLNSQILANDALVRHSDNFQKTGCYNLLCPGFVETAQEMFIGERVENTSVIDRDMAEIAISLVQDVNTENWWLNIDFVPVGYFPKALFSNLVSADEVGWGGTTTTPAGTRAPPMGSGLFPDDNFVHACYFKNVSYQNQFREDIGPYEKRANLFTFTDKPKCYDVQYYGDQGGEVGYSLQFGGPGGDCDS
ncbi:hypothetical protein RIF29_17396 [Crotalaria pallida]|uniref:Neprosin PEP catalytic domain-containing protein n=1 Tax=Crotalaria pallida TaxID=3830 RepID=A0AAN9FQL6_CROPI